MAKYRKKPVVIDAYQFKVSDHKNETEFSGYERVIGGVYEDESSSTGFSVDTLEGKHEVTDLDWIITGVKGEKYPCKPDIFEMTYEKVD